MEADDNPRKLRKPVLLASVGLVGVAILLVSLRSGPGQDSEDAGATLDIPVVAEQTRAPIIEQTEPATATPEPAGVSSPGANPVPIGTASPAARARFRIAVLPARVETPNPAGETFIASVRQAMLQELRAMPNIEVFDISDAEFAATVPPNAGPIGEDRLVFLAVSSRYNSPNVVALSEESQPDSSIWQVRQRTLTVTGSGGSGRAVNRNGDSGAGSDAASVGQKLAQDIVGRSYSQSVTGNLANEFRISLLDYSQSDEVRLSALSSLRNQLFDSEMITAAIGLATQSASAEIRRRAISLLKLRVHDPAVSPHLGFALQSDPDESVRKEAALALAAYVRPGADLRVLEYAMKNDASAEVRTAARLATMNYDEQQAFMRETLLDVSLTPAERLAPRSMMNVRPVIPQTFGAPLSSDQMDEARAISDIVAGTDDMELRLRGLTDLSMITMFGFPFTDQGSIDPAIIDVLIDNAQVADERVRRVALQGLARNVGNENARAVLETLQEEEPEFADELGIDRAIEQHERLQRQQEELSFQLGR